MTDPIADMLTRIRNAQAVGHQAVMAPFSKLKYNLAKQLEKSGFVEKVEFKGRLPRKMIKIILKYDEKERPAISGLKRVSKPGQRIYKHYNEIKLIKAGRGVSIVSTREGLMVGSQAKQKRIGGEILAEVW